MAYDFRIELINGLDDIPSSDLEEMIHDTYDYFCHPTARSVGVNLGAKFDDECDTHEEKCAALREFIQGDCDYIVEENIRQQDRIKSLEEDMQPTYRNLLIYATIANETVDDITAGEYLAVDYITVEDRSPWVGYFAGRQALRKDKISSKRSTLNVDSVYRDNWREFRRTHGLHGVRLIVPSHHTAVTSVPNNPLHENVSIQTYTDPALAAALEGFRKPDGTMPIEMQGVSAEQTLITADFVYKV